MRRFLAERLTFDQLFRYSEPKRVKRSFTVRGPPLEIDANSDAVYHTFNFKSFPSTTGLRHRGYIKFVRPKGKVNGVPLQHVPCEIECTCLAPDAQVLVKDGTYKRIADIKVGDEVYTHRGRLRRVTKNQAREVKPGENVYRISVTGFPEAMLVTGGHPFYTLRGHAECACGCGGELWNAASGRIKRRTLSPDLLLGRAFIHGHASRVVKRDSLGYPARGEVKAVSAGVFQWVKVDDMREQEWFLAPWLEEGCGQAVPPHFARLLGYYAAEGCIPSECGREVRLTFNADEWDTLGTDALAICAKLGYKARRKMAKSGTWFNVIIHDAAFRHYCIEHVGRGSRLKRFSGEVMQWPNDSLRQLCVGTMLGDGSLAAGKTRYCTVNRDLAAQIAAIFGRLGLNHSVSKLGNERLRKNWPAHWNQVQPRMHQVTVRRGASADILRAWMAPFLRQKDLVPLPAGPLHGVRHTRPEGQLRAMQSRELVTDYAGLVHDLTVEEDESFIAHGIAVHNCPDFRYRWAWVLKQHQSSRVGPNSLSQTLNKAPKHTNPGRIPGLCKHCLAARGYIYGLLSQFPDGEPDTAEKLGQLVKMAQKRWGNIDAEIGTAKARDAWYKSARDARNRGLPLPPNPPKALAPSYRLPGLSARGTDDLPLPEPPAETKPSTRGPLLPAAGKPVAEPQSASGLVRVTKPKKRIGDSLMIPQWRVDRLDAFGTNRKVNTMNAIADARKLVEELTGQADDLVIDMPAPSEPPVSDTAVGADTEGNVVLQLLQSIDSHLAVLAADAETAGPGNDLPEAPAEEGDENLDALPEPDAEFDRDFSDDDEDDLDDDIPAGSRIQAEARKRPAGAAKR